MRRGLISRSALELPDAALEARLDRVRAAMNEQKIDALVIYTNNTRPAGVSWLTGFVPYWSEALLVVPRQGTTYLVAALSFRVKSWIERTSRIGEVIHTPRIGLEAARQIAALKSDASVGVVDFDGLPAGVADDFREGGSGLNLSDASALFAKLRGKADPAEIALAVKACAIAKHALADVDALGTASLGATIAVVERQARMLGAEEIYIAAAPDLDRDWRFKRIEGEVPVGKTFALRATLAYKGTWIRLVRTVCEASLAQEAALRLSQAVAQLPDNGGFSGFRSWLVEGCRMAQPLEALIGSPCDAAHSPPRGALVSVQGAVAVDGRTVLVGAPALVGGHGEAASLLVDPLFE
jgi:hypothetical protein